MYSLSELPTLPVVNAGKAEGAGGDEEAMPHVCPAFTVDLYLW